MTENAEVFDYVIVGAGSAGCVLANRLTESGTDSVCLIEAGARATGLFPGMPLAVRPTMQRKDLDWGFVSEPEPALNQRRINVLRGKALGGSSQINGMIYARGDRADYDDWSALGCSGWSYAEVLPYFKRLENSAAGETDFRGGSGPIGVAIPKCPSLRLKDFQQAAINAGHSAVSGFYDGGHLEGFGATELTLRNGRRASTLQGYLRPALRRRNLTLATRSLATRIVFEGDRAVGVEYVRDGRLFAARAQREVILTAGAYGSPQLLQLSGIGPADELQALGIRTVLDLPDVGRNLIEHPLVRMNFLTGPKTFANELRFDRAAVSVLRWALFGNGPAASNAVSCLAFLRTDPNWNRADVQLAPLALDATANIWFPFVKAPVHGFSVSVIVTHVESRGAVTLRSANPADPPRILFNLMQERSDLERMTRGIRATREIYAQEPLRSLITRETLPGGASLSDADLEQSIRELCGIGSHPVGTCKMGTDDHAVVGPDLRVRGVAGLRVADASIMPTIPTGNTNVPTIMIAEKAADLIRGLSPATS